MNRQFSKKEIEKHFQKVGIDITCHGENRRGGIVISRKFKNLEIEKQKNELIEEGMEGDRKRFDEYGNSLNRHFVDNLDSLVYSVEKKGKDGVVKESYIERNQKRRLQESTSADKETKSTEKENSQQNQSQKLENKGNSSKSIYYGISVISLVLVAISVITIWIKKKRKLK